MDDGATDNDDGATIGAVVVSILFILSIL